MVTDCAVAMVVVVASNSSSSRQRRGEILARQRAMRGKAASGAAQGSGRSGARQRVNAPTAWLFRGAVALLRSCSTVAVSLQEGSGH